MRKILTIPMISMSGACATIVEGTDQLVTVSTIPAAAICELSRDGGQIAFVNPTPGTVNIEKSKHDISVRCSKDGYHDGTGVLVSEFEGMTAGNILAGGLIGAAVDASTGAMNIYPSSIVVTLPPL